MILKSSKELTPLPHVRGTTLLRMLLGIQGVYVTKVSLGGEGMVLDVRPSTRVPRCGDCGRRVQAIHDRRERMWRHLDLGGMRAWLRYTIRRVCCPECGVRVEQVPWAESGSRFSKPFENQVAYLAQRCDKTTVTRLMRITWRTVGDIVKRVVVKAGLLSPERFDGLTHIGIDELSYRKHHKYITVVTDHVSGRVVWAGKGKSSETVAMFFKALGPERAAKIECVTLDLSSAFIKGVRENAPQATMIFDRFHVQRLVHNALDEVRRDLARGAETKAERDAVKGTRWALQKNAENLNAVEKGKLQELRQNNAPLIRAYELKESLRSILDNSVGTVARHLLNEWLDWASRSRLKPFVKAGRTIRKHIEGVLEYIHSGLTNSLAEGLNGKTRTITRRSYGFHEAGSLIAMLYLCCGGMDLEPSHLLPHSVP